MKPRLLAISGTLTGTVQPSSTAASPLAARNRISYASIDPVVSRQHSTIKQTADGFELTDLDSHNGTFVNGIPIHRKIIAHGDTIRIGNSELVFLLHEGDVVPTSRSRLTERSSTSTIAINQRTRPHSNPPTFHSEVGRMARDLTALFRISNVINSIRDSELLQRELLRLIFEVIPAESGAVILVTDLDEEAYAISTWNRQSRPRAARSRFNANSSIAPSGSAPPSSQTLHRSPPDLKDSQSILCQPLVAVERTIGVIYLTSPHPAPPFHEDHIHFLDSASHIAAVTLENILALDALRSENLRLKQQLNPTTSLVGESRQIRQLQAFISKVAPSDSTVLIRGESGTGKEVVARSIHQSSPRREKPFIAINCAAIPETLIESELFGHEKGAFTGAVGIEKGQARSRRRRNPLPRRDRRTRAPHAGQAPPSPAAKRVRARRRNPLRPLQSPRPRRHQQKSRTSHQSQPSSVRTSTTAST